MEKHSDKNTLPPLSQFLMSGSTGHLSEKIVSASEALGLVGDSSNNELTTLFGRLPIGLGWNQIGKTATLGLADQSIVPDQLYEMQLSFNEIPIHNARVKTIREQDSENSSYMSGSIPRWLMNGETTQPRATEFSLSTSETVNYAAQQLGFAQWRFHSPRKTYVAQQNQALAATYLFIVSAERPQEGRGPHVPLEVAVSADTGEIFWQRPLAMHAVDGEASLIVENKGTTESVSPVSLPRLQGDGRKLSHPLFDVFNCHQKARASEPGDGSVCDQIAHNVTSGNFNQILYSNEVYDELVAYASTSKAMNWYQTIDQPSFRSSWDDSKWPGARANFGMQPTGSNGGSEVRLKIFVRTRTPVPTTNQCGEDSTPDNAQYLWSGNSGRSGPEILIGYGGYDPSKRNCYKLRDLGKDMDVIMHEFGHHVVFRGLSNSQKQSVAMHEGLADYFTYAISGNNLLAEYSYPGFKALRQGNIAQGTTFRNFKAKPGGGYYSVMDTLSAPHLVGEFWSGILWEIRSTMGRDAASGSFLFDKIVWDSIDLLKSDAGLHEGIVALSESAKRYGLRTGYDPAQLQKNVQDTFVKYGFARYTAGGELAAIAELTGGISSTADEPVTQVKKTRKWGCGDVALAQDGLTSSAERSFGILLWLLVLLLPPTAMTLAPALQKIAIRVRNRRRI